MKIRLICHGLVLAGLLVFAPANSQQSLSPEQLELLNSLPESQREELLQRYLRGDVALRDDALSFPGLVLPRQETKEEDAEPTISGGETLVLNFALKDDLDRETERQFNIDSNKVRLLGSNTYVLDSAGVLRLPGVAEIPLAGLKVPEIVVRLGAEPGLRELNVGVSLLPLAPQGAASLRRFGSELFDAAPSTFAPATDVPVPVEYVVGPGDTVRLQLFGSQNTQNDLVIGRDGILNIPDIGPLGTAGMTFGQLRDELINRVNEQMIGVRASVTMGELRSIRVFVLGDVRTPGSFTVSGLSTMTNALFVSGGIADSGTMRRVQLKRSGRTVGELDLYDLLLKGDTSNDERLQPGDVIFVPPVGATVGVAGQVVRPAIYEARNEKSVGDLLAMAGGLLPTAYRGSGHVERIDELGRRTTIRLDLTARTDLAQAIQNGDSIFVDAVLDVLEDTVVLGGHVFRPGPFQWRQGIRLTDIIASPSALRPQADLGYVLIRREKAATGEVEVVSGDLAAAWRSRGSANDLVLQPRDTVTVFELGPSRGAAVREVMQDLTAQARFNVPYQAVSVSGEVRAEGTYPLEANMLLSDLIRAGGGMSESAYTQRAELTRYFVGEDGRRRSTLMPVNLQRALAGDPQEDIVLQSYDHLSVREIPQWRDQETIIVRGEVRFPGLYTIQRDETLRSVIDRAGGLTDRAFAEGAVFTREALRERERDQIDVLADRLERDLANVALQASRQEDQSAQALTVGQSLLAQLRNSEPVGRLVIDLEQLAVSTGAGASELLLRANDAVYIPEESQEVTVIGEVQYPTSHVYKDGWQRDDYVESSGGLSARADKERIYVVRVDGSVMVENGSRFFRRGGGLDIRPGDTVVVPLDTEKMPQLALWSNVTQIVYNLAVAVAAVNSF